MLTSLRIRDCVLIDELEVEVGKGPSVLSGETGAGKSIVLGASRLLPGGLASVDEVRLGHDRAVGEGILDLSSSPDLQARAGELDVPLVDGCLEIHRGVA